MVSTQLVDPKELGEAAAPTYVRLDYLVEPFRYDRVKLTSAKHVLSARDRNRRAVPKSRIALEVVGLQGFLDPIHAILLDPFGYPKGCVHVQPHKGVGHESDVGPELGANPRDVLDELVDAAIRAGLKLNLTGGDPPPLPLIDNFLGGPSGYVRGYRSCVRAAKQPPDRPARHLAAKVPERQVYATYRH